MINWFSNDTHIFSNPKLSQLELPNQWEGYHDLKGHIWLTSSGTRSSHLKWVALSKKAFLASAAAVNQHLNASSQDRWGIALPIFHTGGLSIYARATLTGSTVIPFSCKWEPLKYTEFLHKENVTFSSLVPTQVVDLVIKKCASPTNLKAVFIGGSALHPELYQTAVKLGWPLLLSYGLTECASQVATAQKGDTSLRILSHMKCKVDLEERLMIKSPALLTGYLIKSEEGWCWNDPKVDGWYKTEDLVELNKGSLVHLGRSDDYLKILGEFVSMNKLEQLFQTLSQFTQKACLVALPDLRNGCRLVAVSEMDYNLGPVVDAFNQQVSPFEQIKEMQYITSIPRSPLGKVLKDPLLNRLIDQ